MPLIKSKSAAAVKKNFATELRAKIAAGYPAKKAAKIAYAIAKSTQRRSKG